MKLRILAFITLLLPACIRAQEFRAMWADTFHAGLDNSTETTALIAAARAAKCNAVIVEVRRRGDAWFRGGIEPTAANVDAVPAKNIASIGVGSPGIVNTTTAHNLTTGDWVSIEGITGSTPVINGTRTVTVVDSDTIRINGVNITAAGTGGTITHLFDPLQDLIRKGHDTSGDQQRIEIHAWIVTYNVWNNETTPPSQPTHPYNLHPDWLGERDTGAKWGAASGSPGNYYFDPGHPGVQRHTFDVCMDIISRYDVDGFHFDYIRYPDYLSSGNNQPWGYNPVTVARYNKLKNLTGVPTKTNGAWLQWRREQVSALVRKVYLHAWAAKPNVRVSAALIAYGVSAPANQTTAAWQGTEAYSRVLQDWKGWMAEGILDLGCPMIYRDENTLPGSFEAWSNFAKDSQFNRAAAMGMGWYLNTVPNTLAQIGTTRSTSPGGKNGAGLVGYSYAVPNDDGTSQSSMWSQLSGGPFAATATVPSMPWKTSATRGHAMGFVTAADLGTGLDGVTVTITGPSNRTLVTDATGFWGAVDLPVGSYSLAISVPGFRTLTRAFTVTGGTVAQPATALEIVPFLITSTTRSTAANTMTIAWNSVPDRTYRVERSPDAVTWTTAAAGITATTTNTSYVWTIPTGWETRAFLRVVLVP